MTKLNKLLPGIAVVVGLGLVGVTSAFKEAPKSNKFDQYLYTYSGSDFTKDNIQNSANYTRSEDACTGSTNVCGVLLPSDQGIGNHPAQTEFDNAKADLWDAQQDPSQAPSDVVLQP